MGPSQRKSVNTFALVGTAPFCLEESVMTEKNVNIDYCGIRTLLRLLEGQGFSQAELKKIAARIAQVTGATIIFC